MNKVKYAPIFTKWISKRFTQPTSLTLVLENCESLVFDWKDVRHVNVDNVTENISYYNENKRTKTCRKLCKGFFITVEETGGKYLFDNGSEHWTKRLVNGDITSICIEYVNGEQDVYNVVWHGGYDYYHPYQGVNKDHGSTTWNIFCNKHWKNEIE